MRNNLLGKIIEWFKNHIFNFYSSCYNNMEDRGIAVMGCCSGTVGGTSATEYLSETCINCPYFVMVK